MGHLFRRRLHVRIAHSRHLLAARPGVDPMGSVETGAVDHGRVVDHGVVDIGVVDDRPVHMQHCGVVGKAPAFPTAAKEADATIAIAIVHTAVEANVGAPITNMPKVGAAAPSPIAGGPQKSWTWRQNPGSGNPEVARIPVRPVARRPQIPVPRTNRLRVNRQHGGSNVHGNEDAGKRRRWHDRYQQCEEQSS